jgi:hypothetical protein
VYVNATTAATVCTPTTAEPDLSLTNTDYDYSERFFVDAWSSNYRIDNITVCDDIWITPPVPTTTSETQTETPTESPTTGNGTPPPFDTTILLVVGGVAAVVIIGAVVCLKRR